MHTKVRFHCGKFSNVTVGFWDERVSFDLLSFST